MSYRFTIHMILPICCLLPILVARLCRNKSKEKRTPINEAASKTVISKKVTLVRMLCADNKFIDVNPAVTIFPPILGRILGVRDGFAPLTVDEDGYARTDILKYFSIERSEFVDCLNFLRTGYIRRRVKMTTTFLVLGGCEAFEAKRKQISQANNAEEMKRIEAVERLLKLKQENPLNPEENLLHLFKFEMHSQFWEHDENWECTSQLPQSGTGQRMLWWRKRV